MQHLGYINIFQEHFWDTFNSREENFQLSISSSKKVHVVRFNVQPQLANDSVKTCIIFNKSLRARDGYTVEDTMSVVVRRNLYNRRPQTSNSMENILYEYFASSMGKFSWQVSKLYEGSHPFV